MSDQTLLIAILAVGVAATAIQAVALVSALAAVRRLEARFAEVERELGALRPHLERLGHVIETVAEWTESAAGTMPRVAADMGGVLERLRGFGEIGTVLLGSRFRPLGLAVSLWKGFRSAASAYRQFVETPRASRSALPVRAADEEAEGGAPSWR